MRGHILPGQIAATLASTALAEAEEPAQARITRPTLWIDQERRAASEIEAAAHQHAHAGFLSTLMAGDDAGERIAVGDAERWQSEQFRLCEQLLGMRGTTQERIVGR